MLTYVAEILHNIERVLRLLVFITHVFNCFLRNKVLGDLGPQLRLAFPDRRLLSPAGDCDPALFDRLWSGRRGERRSNEVVWCIEFAIACHVLGSASTIIALPGNLLTPTTSTVQPDTFSTWRDIHKAPILSCTVVCFSRICSLQSFAIVIVGCLFNIVIVVAAATGNIDRARTEDNFITAAFGLGIAISGATFDFDFFFVIFAFATRLIVS